MIRQLYINHFRGIQEIQLQNIGKVNLLLGRNNCGKSSVLDALYLLSCPTEPWNFVDINAARSYARRGPHDLELNFNNCDMDSPIKIEGQYPEGMRTLCIRKAEDTQSEIILTEEDKKAEEKLTIEYNLQSEYNEDIRTYLSISDKKPKDIRIWPLRQNERKQKIHYVTPSSPYKNMELFFANAIRNKQEKEISEILHSVDPRIEDIVIAVDQILVDTGVRQRLPIQVMGDGMRKILSLIVNLNDAENGILLIDEIDNGLHYTAMEPLWKAILDGATRKNVQIFITTHNIESLRALNHYLENNGMTYQDDLRIYSIKQYEGEDIRAVNTTYPQFNHLINEELELR